MGKYCDWCGPLWGTAAIARGGVQWGCGKLFTEKIVLLVTPINRQKLAELQLLYNHSPAGIATQARYRASNSRKLANVLAGMEINPGAQTDRAMHCMHCPCSHIWISNTPGR